jgi:hypothetical protein
VAYAAFSCKKFELLNVLSLELDAEPAHSLPTHSLTHSLTRRRTCFIHCDPRQHDIDYESELLGPMYGLIRQELLNVATSTLRWAVQLRNSYDSISTMGGFSESDLVVLTNTLSQDLSDYAEPDVELLVSRVNKCGGARYPIDLPTITIGSRCSHPLGRFRGPHSTGHLAHSSCPGLP